MNFKKLSMVAMLAVTSLFAEDAKPKTGGSDAQANNPLANFTAFNIHNYYIGDVTETDKDANQAWMRFAKPFTLGDTNWLFRASLPINSYAENLVGDMETNIGDLNLFAAYMIDVGNPAISFGFGPQLTLPTSTGGLLDSEKYSAGLVNVLFNAESKVFQYGYLLSWQGSFAGESDKPDVNLGAFQPFVFYQLGGGTYLRSAAIMYKNFENETYSVPIGLGVGQVFKTDDVVYNLFVEPQVSVADDGPGISRWQVFLGLNMQFN